MERGNAVFTGAGVCRLSGIPCYRTAERFFFVAQEQQATNVSNIPALRDLVQEVSRTRRLKALCVDSGEVVFVTPANPVRRPARVRDERRREESFLASYQAVPALGRRMTVEEMTEIAAEEHAQEAAGKGL
jgi:hypothetical protein